MSAARLLRRAATATVDVDAAMHQAIAETVARLGRQPGGRGREAVCFVLGSRIIAVDEPFHEAMKAAPAWGAYLQALSLLKQEEDRFRGVLVPSLTHPGWRTTETKDRRLWFHPADYPVRAWAVAIRPEGAGWANADIIGIDNTYIRVRYHSQPARLDRKKPARSWTLYRTVYFTSSRSGYAARSRDEMWRQRYWRPGWRASIPRSSRGTASGPGSSRRLPRAAPRSSGAPTSRGTRVSTCCAATCAAPTCSKATPGRHSSSRPGRRQRAHPSSDAPPWYYVDAIRM